MKSWNLEIIRAQKWNLENCTLLPGPSTYHRQEFILFFPFRNLMKTNGWLRSLQLWKKTFHDQFFSFFNSSILDLHRGDYLRKSHSSYPIIKVSIHSFMHSFVLLCSIFGFSGSEMKKGNIYLLFWIFKAESSIFESPLFFVFVLLFVSWPK